MNQKKKLDFSRLFFCSTIILCGSLAKHACPIRYFDLLASRFVMQDSQKEARIRFKNQNELVAFLEGWMKSSSEDDSNKKEMTK